MTTLKSFSGKVRQSVQDYLNQTLVIGSFLENGFVATLSWKTNVPRRLKRPFCSFLKSLSDEVETFFWESDAMLQKRFR